MPSSIVVLDEQSDATPLALACGMGHKEVAFRLIQLGADLTIVKDDVTSIIVIIVITIIIIITTIITPHTKKSGDKNK